jgi:hypothetical protein
MGAAGAGVVSKCTAIHFRCGHRVMAPPLARRSAAAADSPTAVSPDATSSVRATAWRYPQNRLPPHRGQAPCRDAQVPHYAPMAWASFRQVYKGPMSCAHRPGPTGAGPAGQVPVGPVGWADRVDAELDRVEPNGPDSDHDSVRIRRPAKVRWSGTDVSEGTGKGREGHPQVGLRLAQPNPRIRRGP